MSSTNERIEHLLLTATRANEQANAGLRDMIREAIDFRISYGKYDALPKGTKEIIGQTLSDFFFDIPITAAGGSDIVEGVRQEEMEKYSPVYAESMKVMEGMTGNELFYLLGMLRKGASLDRIFRFITHGRAMPLELKLEEEVTETKNSTRYVRMGRKD